MLDISLGFPFVFKKTILCVVSQAVSQAPVPTKAQTRKLSQEKDFIFLTTLKHNLDICDCLQTQWNCVLQGNK